MILRNLYRSLLLTACLACPMVGAEAQGPTETFNVWPGDPPTTVPVSGPEHVLEGRPRPFYQITDVATPTVSVYLPPEESRTGAAILVCPGGGLQRLAIEHEGIEVARWLNQRGITAFVLKYRVPASAQIGLQDAQRAISIVRSRAKDWGVDPETIGTMGFSAGGEIGAWMATHHERRQYEPIDQYDSASCRPAYAVLVYPGGLVSSRTGQVKEEVFGNIDGNTSPMFFAHAFDDSCQNSLRLALALKKARVPAEVHIYQQGGHGFGARGSGHAVAAWKDAFETWAASNGFLDPGWLRRLERGLRQAMKEGGPLPRMHRYRTDASIGEGFAVQKRLVRNRLTRDSVAGFKGGAISQAAQDKLGLHHPLSGVLFQSGSINAEDDLNLPLDEAESTLIETELGFIVAVDIGYEVLTVQQARDAVEKVVPVIELPRSYASQATTPLTAAEIVALNVGADRFIIGQAKDPKEIDLLNLPIHLDRDGHSLHRANSSQVKGDQWKNLHTLMNQIVSQGYTIPAGSVIISGAIGEVHSASVGKYSATFGDLGEINFELISASREGGSR